MLTEKQALQIFEIKLSLQSKLSQDRSPSVFPNLNRSLIRGMSGPVSKLFGISPRAVRDVWNRRTWCDTTKHLWHRDRFTGTLTDDPSGTKSSSLQVRSTITHLFEAIAAPDTVPAARRWRPQATAAQDPKCIRVVRAG